VRFAPYAVFKVRRRSDTGRIASPFLQDNISSPILQEEKLKTHQRRTLQKPGGGVADFLAAITSPTTYTYIRTTAFV
jgi:hypothetical protein